MSTCWYLAKFVPDLRRFEPKNVGVIAFVDGRPAARFFGEGPEAQIDGRTVRSIPDADAYRAWIEAWRFWSTNRDPERDRAVFQRRPGDQFYIEAGGELLLGAREAKADALADRLFAELVGPKPTRESETRIRVGKSAGDVWGRIIRHWQHRDLAETFEEKTIVGACNTETFRHVYANSIDHVVEPLSLDLGGPRRIQHFGASWGGRIRALRPDPKRFRVDLVIGMPPLDAGNRREAAEEVADFLATDLKDTSATRVVREAELEVYAAELEKTIAAHEAAHAKILTH